MDIIIIVKEKETRTFHQFIPGLRPGGAVLKPVTAPLCQLRILVQLCVMESCPNKIAFGILSVMWKNEVVYDSSVIAPVAERIGR